MSLRKYEICLIEYERQLTREINSVKLFFRESVLWSINKRHLDGIIRNFVETRKIFGFVSRFLCRASVKRCGNGHSRFLRVVAIFW